MGSPIKLAARPAPSRVKAATLLSALVAGLLTAAVARAQQIEPQLGDLRLVSAYVLARGLSAEVNTANADVSIALGTRDRARAAQYPQLGAKVEYDYAHQSVEGDYFGFADIDRSDSFDRFAYGVSASQGVYRPDLWNATDIANAGLRGAELGLSEAESGLAVRLAQEYLLVVTLMETLRAQLAELSATEEQQRQVEDRARSGLVRDADVAAVRAARESAVANKIDIENNLEAARLKLRISVGGDFKRIAVLMPQTPLPKLDPPELDTWVATALEKRPALAAAREGVVAAQLGLSIAKGRRLPTVDLVGSHAYFDSSGGISGAREDLDQRIGLELKLPLFTSGLVTADIHRAEGQLARAQAQASGAQQGVKAGVQRAYMSAISSYRQIDARRRALDAAVEAERTSRVSFEVGTVTAADWLDVVRKRFNAARDFSRERLNYLLAVVQLKAATGVLTRDDLTRVERLLVFPDDNFMQPPDLASASFAPGTESP